MFTKYVHVVVNEYLPIKYYKINDYHSDSQYSKRAAFSQIALYVFLN